MYPNMVGHYIFADAGAGDFWDLDTDNNWASTFHSNLSFGVVSFGEDINGEIYVVNIGGTIYHLEEANVGSTPTVTPTNTVMPTNTPTATPLPPFTPNSYQFLPAVEYEN